MRARVCVSLSSRTFQWRWWILNAECNKSSPNLEFNVTSWKYGMHATMVTFGQDQVNSTKRQEHEWILKWMRYHHIWLTYVCMHMRFDYGAGGLPRPPCYDYPLFSVIFSLVHVYRPESWYYFMHSMWLVGRFQSIEIVWSLGVCIDCAQIIIGMCERSTNIWCYYRFECALKIEIITIDLAAGVPNPSLHAHRNARFPSTLPQKIKTTFMVLLWALLRGQLKNYRYWMKMI